MNELKQAMAEVIRQACEVPTLNYAREDGQIDFEAMANDQCMLSAQAILDMPAIKQALEMHYNYQGALADIESLVAAFRKRMPDDEWLNLNYPIKNTASLNGGIRQLPEASASSDEPPASGMGLPNSSDGGVIYCAYDAANGEYSSCLVFMRKFSDGRIKVLDYLYGGLADYVYELASPPTRTSRCKRWSHYCWGRALITLPWV